MVLLEVKEIQPMEMELVHQMEVLVVLEVQIMLVLEEQRQAAVAVAVNDGTGFSDLRFMEVVPVVPDESSLPIIVQM